jgi:hypothetical protein
MTKPTFVALLAFALLVGALTAAKAQTCTTTTFMGTTTARCSTGSSAVSNTFMGTTTTRVQAADGSTLTCTTTDFMGTATTTCR